MIAWQGVIASTDRYYGVIFCFSNNVRYSGRSDFPSAKFSPRLRPLFNVMYQYHFLPRFFSSICVATVSWASLISDMALTPK